MLKPVEIMCIPVYNNKYPLKQVQEGMVFHITVLIIVIDLFI
jgi:hypothetical protein